MLSFKPEMQRFILNCLLGDLIRDQYENVNWSQVNLKKHQQRCLDDAK